MPTKRRTGKLDRFNGPPTGEFQVNQDLARSLGLVAWYSAFGSMGGYYIRDRVGNCHVPLPPQSSQTSIWTIDPIHGVEWRTTAGGGTDRTPKSSYAPLYLRPYSIFCWFRSYSAALVGSYFSIYDGVDDADQIWLGSDPSGNFVFRARSGSTNTVTGNSVGTNEVHFGAATNENLDQRLYQNGYLVGTPGTGTVELSAGNLGVGIMRGQYDGEGGFFEGGICNTLLSPAQIFDLYQNRWDLYEPMHPTFYSIPGTLQPVKRTRHTLNGGWAG